LGEGNGLKERRRIVISSLTLSNQNEKKLNKGKHLVFSTEVGNSSIQTLLDNGSEGELLDYSLARRLKFPIFKLKKRIPLYLANGEKLQSITEAALVDLRIGEHVEQMFCYLVKLPGYKLILGDGWLQEHNPQVDWKARTITFNSTDCFEKGCLTCGRPYTAHAKGGWQSSTHISETNSGPIEIKMVSARHFLKLAKKKENQGCMWSPREQEKKLYTTALNAVVDSDYDKFMDGKPSYTLEELKEKVPKEYHGEIEVFMKREADKLPPHRQIDHEIHLEEGRSPPFVRNYKPMSTQELEAVKKYIDEHLGKGFIRSSASPAAAPVLLVKKPGGGIRVCVDYRALNEITVKNRYPIPLIAETLGRLTKAKIYTKLDIIHAFNRVRIKEGHEWMTAFNTRYGQFEYQVMPFGLCNAPGTFQSFINDSVREYLDIFCSAYLDDILIYSESTDEHIEHVRKILRKLLENSLYLDIDKCEFHKKEVKYLGLIVSTEGIKMDPEKVEAILNWQAPKSVSDIQSFLGFAGFYRRFIRDFSRKTKVLNDLTKGETYRTASGKRKVKYYPFAWTEDCNKAFEALKTAFRDAPILAHFDPEKETWIETDSSDFVSAGVLSQMHDGILRPVAFFSKKLSPTECNYMIYDKELLAIIRSFETWRPETMSVAPDNPVKVFTDHKNLEYFMTTKQLNRRQARWAEFLSEFNFKIMYRPGKQGEKPDILTRRSQDLPKGFKDERQRHQFQTLIQEHQLDEDLRMACNAIFLGGNESDSLSEEDDSESVTLDNLDTSETGESESSLSELDPLITEAYENDEIVKRLIAAKEQGLRRLPREIMDQGIRLAMGDLGVRGERLWVREKLYIPDHKPLRLKIMELHHEDPIAGHPGIRGMYRQLVRHYWWPKIKEDCAQYVNNCSQCNRGKPRTTKKQGLLNPLPIPEHKWMDLSMDFITDLPPCTRRGRTYRHILVIVDRLTKGRHYEPLTSLTVDELYDAMNRRVFCVHGLPLSIVSDRGKQMISRLWQRLCQRRRVKIKLSSAQHPETDGQTEIANKFLKGYLRNYVDFLQDNWIDFLPDAEFMANNFVNESTGITPFFADKGYHPRTGIEPPSTYDNRGKAEVERADEITKRVEEMRNWLQDQLTWAQEEYTRHANKNRQPHPEYRVGDRVYVDARHFAAERPSRSLGQKYAGPWAIKRVIDNKAYEIDLPDHLIKSGLTSIFHPWKLHLAPSNPYPGQATEPQGPILITEGLEDTEDSHEEWEVLEVVDCRETKRFGTQYKATFMGDWDDWNSKPPWQPWTDFKRAEDKILEFHQLHSSLAYYIRSGLLLASSKASRDP
jgi:transposase InsO family protein